MSKIKELMDETNLSNLLDGFSFLENSLEDYKENIDYQKEGLDDCKMNLNNYKSILNDLKKNLEVLKNTVINSTKDQQQKIKKIDEIDEKEEKLLKLLPSSYANYSNGLIQMNLNCIYTHNELNIRFNPFFSKGLCGSHFKNTTAKSHIYIY